MKWGDTMSRKMLFKDMAVIKFSITSVSVGPGPLNGFLGIEPSRNSHYEFDVWCLAPDSITGDHVVPRLGPGDQARPMDGTIR